MTQNARKTKPQTGFAESKKGNFFDFFTAIFFYTFNYLKIVF